MYFRFPSALRLGDIDDNPYTLRGPFARGIRRAPRLINPLRLDDDNDWLRSGSLLRRTSSPLVGRGQLATRGLTRGLRRGLYLDDDSDNWYTSVMNRGRRLARGGPLGGLTGDDDDNDWRSPFSRSRGAMGRMFRNPWMNNDDDNWSRPNRLGLRSLGLGRTSLSQRFGSVDDDNNYENMFGRGALSNGLQGLRNAAAPLRLDNNDDNAISPLLPTPQLSLDDDDDDRFSSLSSLRSSLGGPLGGRRFF